MPVPSNAWEHLQSTLMQTYNKDVRTEFNDADDDNFTTPRGSLKMACTIRDSDSAVVSLIRMVFFYFTVKGGEELRPNLYAIPTDQYQQRIRFAPQVTLYFAEDMQDVAEGYAPIDAQLSFRLKNETETTFTPGNALTLANKIRAEFATGTPFRWRKGRVRLNYQDLDRGYSLKVHAFNEAEGKELIRKVLSLQGDTLDGSKLTINTLDEAPPIIPPSKNIYGKQRRLPRKRPIGHVRFRWAEVHIHGMPNAVVLIDLTGRRKGALIPAF